MSSLHISLCQFNIAWMDPEQNFRKIKKLLEDASETDLIVLPEMFNTGFCIKEPQMAEAMDEQSVSFMKELAQEHDAYVAGSLMIEDEGKIYNRFLLVSAQGVEQQYDKMHLFALSSEHEHFTAGNQKIDFEIKGVKIRSVICYDIRFPYVCYNDSNYQLLLVVANWPVMRIAHWENLLMARAIENQSYVVAVNRVGVDPFGVEYPGHSIVYDANGISMLRFTGETVKKVEIDTLELGAFRKKLPFIGDQRN